MWDPIIQLFNELKFNENSLLLNFVIVVISIL